MADGREDSLISVVFPVTTLDGSVHLSYSGSPSVTLIVRDMCCISGCNQDKHKHLWAATDLLTSAHAFSNFVFKLHRRQLSLSECNTFGGCEFHSVYRKPLTFITFASLTTWCSVSTSCSCCLCNETHDTHIYIHPLITLLKTHSSLTLCLLFNYNYSGKCCLWESQSPELPCCSLALIITRYSLNWKTF